MSELKIKDNVRCEDVNGNIYLGRVFFIQDADAWVIIDKIEIQGFSYIHHEFDLNESIINHRNIVSLFGGKTSDYLNRAYTMPDIVKGKHTRAWISEIINLIRPVDLKISEQGRFLSDAGRYSKNSQGETGGPSGLKFL